MSSRLAYISMNINCYNFSCTFQVAKFPCWDDRSDSMCLHNDSSTLIVFVS